MKFVKAGFMSLVLAALLASCAAKDAGTLVFATDATWPPMEFINADKELVGFDVDLITAVAKEAGFKFKLEVVSWDGIFAGLENKNYDAIISSVTINDERKAKYDFSTPYVQSGQILLAPEGTADDLTLAALGGKSVGAQIGTAGSLEIQKYPEIALKEYSELGLAIQDMVNGNLVGVVCDLPVAVDFALQNETFKGKLKVVGTVMTSEDFGIVVRKGDKATLEKLNKGLAAVLANGTRDSIKAKWGLK